MEDRASYVLAEALRREIKNCGEKREQVLVLGLVLVNWLG